MHAAQRKRCMKVKDFKRLYLKDIAKYKKNYYSMNIVGETTNWL
jgi:chloramphenicol O-acetyltransferase